MGSSIHSWWNTFERLIFGEVYFRGDSGDGERRFRGVTITGDIEQSLTDDMLNIEQSLDDGDHNGIGDGGDVTGDGLGVGVESSFSVTESTVGVDKSSFGGGVVVDMFNTCGKQWNGVRWVHSIIGLAEMEVCVGEGEPTGTFVLWLETNETSSEYNGQNYRTDL